MIKNWKNYNNSFGKRKLRRKTMKIAKNKQISMNKLLNKTLKKKTQAKTILKLMKSEVSSINKLLEYFIYLKLRISRPISTFLRCCKVYWISEIRFNIFSKSLGFTLGYSSQSYSPWFTYTRASVGSEAFWGLKFGEIGALFGYQKAL